jgi:hypothetical protein
MEILNIKLHFAQSYRFYIKESLLSASFILEKLALCPCRCRMESVQDLDINILLAAFRAAIQKRACMIQGGKVVFSWSLNSKRKYSLVVAFPISMT